MYFFGLARTIQGLMCDPDFCEAVGSDRLFEGMAPDAQGVQQPHSAPGMPWSRKVYRDINAKTNGTFFAAAPADHPMKYHSLAYSLGYDDCQVSTR